MKRVLLYSFIIGCLTSCSHLCLVPAIKNQDYKGGYFNVHDTCLKKEYYEMSGGERLSPIIKGVEAAYEVKFRIGSLAPIDSIQLVSVCFIDETSQDTIRLKKWYAYYSFALDRLMGSDSIQSTPFVVKLDPKDTSSNIYLRKSVWFSFYPNLTKKQKKHTFSISYHLKVNEEDIIINDRKLIFISLKHRFRHWYDYFLWPYYLIC